MNTRIIPLCCVVGILSCSFVAAASTDNGGLTILPLPEAIPAPAPPLSPVPVAAPRPASPLFPVAPVAPVAPVPAPRPAAAAPQPAAAIPPAAQPDFDETTDTQWDEIGDASWYGGRFQGRKTANGEVFDTNLLTAAHKTLPFNTIVRVHNPENGQSVLVRINDRGPFVENRIIDLSQAAAGQIGIAQAGISEVRLKIVRMGEESQLVTIQMGAFSKYENAVDLISDLERDGFIPQIENTNTALFRVVLTDVSRSRLDSVRQQLNSKGYVNTLVRVQ